MKMGLGTVLCGICSTVVWCVATQGYITVVASTDSVVIGNSPWLSLVKGGGCGVEGKGCTGGG